MNISRCVNNESRIIEYNPPKGTRVSNVRFLVARNHHISFERGPNRGFSLSHESLERNRRLVPRNALSSLSPPFLFPSLSFFSPLFQRKAPIARRTASETEGGGRRRGKEETICGGAVARRRANTGQPDFTVSRKTPGSRPIPRSCSVMQVLSASTAWILYRAYIHIYIYTEEDEKADHLSSIEIRGQPTRGKRDRIVKLRVLALAALRSSSTMLTRCTQDRASPEGDR